MPLFSAQTISDHPAVHTKKLFFHLLAVSVAKADDQLPCNVRRNLSVAGCSGISTAAWCFPFVLCFAPKPSSAAT